MLKKLLQLLALGLLLRASKILLFGDEAERVVEAAAEAEQVVPVLTLAVVVEEQAAQVDLLHPWNILSP
jgi:hypothetical protein